MSNMNKEPDNYCVYAHINKINGKMYIGITKDIKSRWTPSAYKLSPYFSRAIQKYGWDNFKHIIILDKIIKDVACECEKELIKKYNTTNSQYGYNIAKGGTGGATRYGEIHPLSKEVHRYDLDGNYIDSWINSNIASIKLGITASDIHATARGEVKQAGGFQWNYKKVEQMEKYPGRWVGNKKHYPMIYQLDCLGNIIAKHEDVHNLSSYNKKQRDKIIECCRGKRLSAYGYFWMFENDYCIEKVNSLLSRKNQNNAEKLRKRICLYGLDGKLIKIFDSKEEASDFSGVKSGTIQHSCVGYDNYHRTKEFLWYYYEETHGQDVEPWKNERLRSVLQFDTNGNFIERYQSMSDAKNIFGGSICQALYSNKHYAYNNLWFFEDETKSYIDTFNLKIN